MAITEDSRAAHVYLPRPRRRADVSALATLLDTPKADKPHELEAVTRNIDKITREDEFTRSEQQMVDRDCTLMLGVTTLLPRLIVGTRVRRPDDTMVMMAKAVFADSYEHCSVLGPQVANYRQLYQLRIQQALKLLAKKSLP